MFTRYAAPRLQMLGMVALAEHCQVFSNMSADEAGMYCRHATDAIGAELSDYAMRHVGRWGTAEIDIHKNALARGAAAAIPQACAELRADPEIMLTFKQIVLLYFP